MAITIKLEQVNPLYCPICNYKLDAHTAASESLSIPEDGDISVCFNCTTTLIYVVNDKGLDLRLPTKEELEELENNEELTKIKQTLIIAKTSQNGLN